MSDNNDEPLIEVEGTVAPEDGNEAKKPKKGKGAKLKDKFKRSQRLSAGDIGSIAPDDATSAKKLEKLSKLSGTDPEDMKKKDLEKSVTNQKAFDRKEQLKAAGIDEEAKHSFYDKVKQANDKYKKSGFGESVDRLGRNMKTVGQGAEAMTEAALLETALYNMLMLLFELLFGAKKGVKKLPEGAKWLNANRKRQHLYSGALRRYAKEDHGKALKEADGLKKEIDDLKKERADLKAEKKELEEKNKTPPISDAALERYGQIDERLKANKSEIAENQGKYDSAMLKMAKAENTFKQHGDATKNEKWQKAMEEYKEILPKLKEASEKYKADKKIVDETPLLQRDAKRAELKLDQQKVGLEALKQKELDLYNRIEKIEKSIGKTSAELAEMQKAANKDHPEGIAKARKIDEILQKNEDLASKIIDSKAKSEAQENNKIALLKEQKEIKELRDELKKIPDTKKTPEEKAQKAALDKRAAEIKGKLINLDGKNQALDSAVKKANDKLVAFKKLEPEQLVKKQQKDPTFTEEKFTKKLDKAKENRAEYQKLGTDLIQRKAQLEAKKEDYRKLQDGHEKKTPERAEKLEKKLNRVNGELDKYNAESTGQIKQTEQNTKNLEEDVKKNLNEIAKIQKTPNANTPVVEVTNPNPSPSAQANVNPSTPIPTGEPPVQRQRAQSAPVNSGTQPVFSTTAVPQQSVPVTNPIPNPTVTPVPQQQPQQAVPESKPKDLPTPPRQQAQAQPIFATSAQSSDARPQTPEPRAKKAQPPVPKPTLASVKNLDELVKKYKKMDHPVPRDDLMSRFKELMTDGAHMSQQFSMSDFLKNNPSFSLSNSVNINSPERKLKSLEMMFGKAYLDHLRSTDTNIRTLSPAQAEQVKKIALAVANNPETTSLLKASAEQRVNAQVQALATAGAQPAEPKPESEKVSMAGDLAIADKDKVKTDDKRKVGSGSHK